MLLPARYCLQRQSQTTGSSLADYFSSLLRSRYRCNTLPHQLLLGWIGSNIRCGAPGAASGTAVTGGAAGDATTTFGAADGPATGGAAVGATAAGGVAARTATAGGATAAAGAAACCDVSLHPPPSAL